MSRRSCSNCGADIIGGDKFCATCGTPVGRLCTECGTPLQSGDRFCAACGSPQDPTGPERSEFGSQWETILRRLRAGLSNEYRITRELGRGGQAAVFLAEERSLHRQVAIKVLAPGTLTDDAAVDRFLREARTVAALEHEHIVPIYAVRQVEELHCFVMRYILGRSLAAIIADCGQLPLNVIRAVAFQVGSALQYAHRKGVVHRDVKPANVLFSEEGSAIVTDFGIAKDLSGTRSTVTGMLMGTPAYMSPEQCRQEGLSWSSDQYSLGIVLYEMLTGDVPFEGTSLDMMIGHTDREPAAIRSKRADCPVEMEWAVLRMLKKRPAERWTTMGEALENLGAGPLAMDDPIRSKLRQLALQGSEYRGAAVTPTPTEPSRRVASREMPKFPERLGDAPSVTPIRDVAPTVAQTPTATPKPVERQPTAAPQTPRQVTPIPTAPPVPAPEENIAAVLENDLLGPPETGEFGPVVPGADALPASEPEVEGAEEAVSGTHSLVFDDTETEAPAYPDTESEPEAAEPESVEASTPDFGDYTEPEPVRSTAPGLEMPIPVAPLVTNVPDGRDEYLGGSQPWQPADRVTGRQFDVAAAVSSGAATATTGRRAAKPGETRRRLIKWSSVGLPVILLAVVIGQIGLGSRGGEIPNITQDPDSTVVIAPSGTNEPGRRTDPGKGAVEPVPVATGQVDTTPRLQIANAPRDLVTDEPFTLRASFTRGTSPADPPQPVQWVSSDESVIRMNPDGTGSAVGPGEARITASTGAASQNLTIRVAARAPTTLVMDAPTRLTAGQSRNLSVRAADQRGAPIAAGRVQWRVLNPALASIDENGRLTAQQAGTVQVEAKAGTAVTMTSVTIEAAAAPVSTPQVQPLSSSLSVSSRECTVGAECSFRPMSVSGGSGPYRFAIAPSLPAGLALDAGSGAISGSARSAAQPQRYTMTATDQSGAESRQAFLFAVAGPSAPAADPPPVTPPAGGATGPVTESEAMPFVNELVRLIKARDVTRLRALHSGAGPQDDRRRDDFLRFVEQSRALDVPGARFIAPARNQAGSAPRARLSLTWSTGIAARSASLELILVEGDGAGDRLRGYRLAANPPR
jgi:serine/threonine-protein kinase